MSPRPFFRQVFAALVLSLLAASALFGFVLYRHLSISTLETLKADLRKETETLAEIVMASPDILNDPRRIIHAVRTEDRITIIAPDGVVLADNWAEIMHKEILENHAGRPEIKAAMRGEPIFIQRFSKTIQKELLYYGVPVKDSAGNIAFVLRLSFALTTYQEQMTAVRDYLVGAALLSLLLSLPLAYLVSRASTRQIRRLRAAAERVAHGDLTHPIQEEGSLEFRELAADFNTMAHELNQKILSIGHQHKQTETLLSRMVEGVLAVDENGKAIFTNNAFARMFGLKEERIQGRSMLEIIRNDELADFITALLRDADAPQSKEIRILSPDGEKTFSVQNSRILEDAEQERLLLVFHDITGMKRVEQVRKDFVANVSHELRTPLTALIGSTEVLLDGLYEKPAESRKFLEIMDKQLRNIQNLVSDMLKLAAVEDVRTPFRRETIMLKDFIDDVIAPVQPLAFKKGQQLNVSLPEQPVTLNVDAQQLSAALINLLDNAVKYTEEKGVIELLVSVQTESIQIAVRDNGPGIPREVQPRIFERFYRIDKSRSRDMGGTGLGLAIAKHAVENHGGTLTVQSTPGHGATFLIELPASCLA